MTEADKSFCESWCRAHARKWQVLNRAQWKYQFHEKTLVRFVDEVQLREDEIRLLLEFLASDDCVPTLCLYDQDISPEWKPTRAWLEISNRSVGSVHAVRLYHGLMTELSALGDGPYLVEDGCARKVSLTYYWNQASVKTVPESSSGVSYRITGLTRDRDTGLYTYAIEKLERVQQDVAEYFTAKTVFAEQTEEYHLGVKQGRVESTGKQASVANGKTVRRKISKNADCTSDVHNTTEIEKRAEGASESVHKTLTGTTVTTVNRNMPSKADDGNLGIGESVENSETPGGLWNQTIRKVVRNALDWIAGSCRRTVFHHVHSDTRVQSEDPGFTHAEEAGGGHIRETDVSLTSDGAYRVTERDTEEKAVQNASETVHRSLTGTTRRVTHRYMPGKGDAGDLGIGESVENAMTDGGRWNVSFTKVVRNIVNHISDSCSKTIFHHRQGSVDVRGTDPGFTHVEEASGGVIHRTSVSVTSDGSYRVDDDTTVEKPVRESSRTASMTLRGLTVRTEHRHQSSPLPDPTEVGHSVTNTKTEGGLYNTVDVREGASPAGRIAESCARNYYGHTHSETSNDAELADPEHVFEVGKVVSKSGNLNSNGTADNTVRVSEAVPQINEYSYRRDDGSVVHVVKYANQGEPYLKSHPSIDGSDNLNANDSVNEYGLHDGVVSWTTNTAWRYWWSDLKFIKHGKAVDFYDYRFDKRTRKWYHRRWSVQLHWIKGDAYTDYVSDWMRADPNRITAGVMKTRLVSRYHDQFGNELAEWKWVELVQRDAGWVMCTNACTHPSPAKADPKTLLECANELLRGDDEGRGGTEENRGILKAIENIPSSLASALTGRTQNSIREQLAAAEKAEKNARKEAEKSEKEAGK